MNKKNIIGIIISLIGLFIMGLEIGKNLKNRENSLTLTFTGLFIVFIGAFIVISFNKKKMK
ncbi:hypothetical protein [Cellulophaga baltica]|uniref:hypothetical protein n=1 Tax=Cellulophaga baltica TaxID=76594 RepID=UPI0015F6C739|nr:hypothetical protein [Cellulophaga baltica]MBA6316971.1 hypothetical protein [Cellulophaga baltica]